MNKERIYKNYLNTAISLSKKNLKTILEASKIGIDPELLFSIVIIEKMNRGNFSNYIFEKLLSTLAPSIIIKLNASIGLSQIRVRTAKKVLAISDKDIVKKLMLPKDNIEIMAKLIKLYIDENIEDKNNLTRTILNLHITGKKYVSPNIYLNMYYELVDWSILEKYFSKIHSNTFKL